MLKKKMCKKSFPFDSMQREICKEMERISKTEFDSTPNRMEEEK